MQHLTHFIDPSKIVYRLRRFVRVTVDLRRRRRRREVSGSADEGFSNEAVVSVALSIEGIVVVVTIASSSSRLIGSTTMFDSFFGVNSRGSCDSSLVSPLAEDAIEREIVWLQSIFQCVRELMIKLWNISPRILDEVQSIISQIGKHPDVTSLYEILTSRDKWVVSVQPFDEPVVVTTVFGMMKYEQRHALDRVVYNVLAEQSLTVVYNTYLSVTTPERLRSVTRLVEFVERLKRYSFVDDSRLAQASEVIRCLMFQQGTKSLHVIVHTILSLFDMDRVRTMGRIYANAVTRMSDHLADSIERAQNIVNSTVAEDDRSSISFFRDDNDETSDFSPSTKKKRRKRFFRDDDDDDDETPDSSSSTKKKRRKRWIEETI